VLAIYTLKNNILAALDNKLLVGGLLCDLTKAFNCVKYDKLLPKLEYYGINGEACDLIISNLMTYQGVIIKMNTCYWDKAKQGVPQGSILSPVFLI
jgi:hypothetical protein